MYSIKFDISYDINVMNPCLNIQLLWLFYLWNQDKVNNGPFNLLLNYKYFYY